MQGADNQHFPVLPGDVDDAVQARYKRLIQDAGFQCQVIIGGQQQKESRMQRRFIADLLEKWLVVHRIFDQRDDGAHSIKHDQNNQKIQIGVWVAVARRVWYKQILRDSNCAAQNREKNNHAVQKFLERGFLLFFQLLELLAVELFQLCLSGGLLSGRCLVAHKNRSHSLSLV